MTKHMTPRSYRVMSLRSGQLPEFKSEYQAQARCPRTARRMRALPLLSIRTAEPVLLLTKLTVGRRFGVVQLMLDRLQRLQECEHGFQIVVSHLAIKDPRHRRIHRARAHLAAAHYLHNRSVVEIANARPGRADVGGHHT